MVTMREHDNSIGSDGDIPFDEEVINVGGHFDFSIHAYVVPVDGYYQ